MKNKKFSHTTYNKEWLNFSHFSVYNPGIRRYNIESRVPA